jgi:hypothetical protein
LASPDKEAAELFLDTFFRVAIGLDDYSDVASLILALVIWIEGVHNNSKLWVFVFEAFRSEKFTEPFD